MGHRRPMPGCKRGRGRAATSLQGTLNLPGRRPPTAGRTRLERRCDGCERVRVRRTEQCQHRGKGWGVGNDVTGVLSNHQTSNALAETVGFGESTLTRRYQLDVDGKGRPERLNGLATGLHCRTSDSPGQIESRDPSKGEQRDASGSHPAG